MIYSNHYDEPADVPRWKMLLILVLDASSRTSETQMNCIRDSIEELLPELVDIQNSDNVDVYIRTITYNISAKFHEQEAVRADVYSFPMFSCFGLSNFGEACYRLNSILNTEKIVNSNGPIHFNFAPIILFNISSNPTGMYMHGIRKLKSNRFYNDHCYKVYHFMGKAGMNYRFYDALFLNDTLAKEINGFTPETIKKCLIFEELKHELLFGNC